MRCLSGSGVGLRQQKGVFQHRLFLYISGKLCNTCHHPGLNCQTPAGFVLQGFFFALHHMPKSAPKPCSQPGCGVLVRDGSSRCAKHPREAWSKPVTASKRVTGRKLQTMRTRLFESNPLCAECERHERVALATQRDHIKPLAEGGLDDDSNVQGLCEPCHDAKSKAEAKRGQSRRAW